MFLFILFVVCLFTSGTPDDDEKLTVSEEQLIIDKNVSSDVRTMKVIEKKVRE